ncbi:MAG: hypothetical protein ACI9IV_002572 [Paracoccaceae bacterium]|jgi:hypothetical protein
MAQSGILFMVLACLIALVSGCAQPVPFGAVQPAPPATATPPVAPPSAESRALRRHYRQVQADLLGQGLLRQDRGGPDVPFNARNLTDNFIKIALFEEYTRSGGRLIAKQAPTVLKRWDQPVRVSVQFGPSVPDATRQSDTTTVARYTRQLARATGHPVSFSNNDPNFFVLILSEDERRGVGPQLHQLMPGIDDSTVRQIEGLGREIFCVVSTFSTGSDTQFRKAVAVIRAEHPDLLRTACLHEEIAQGLGLSNDSPAARPSIFNDDEEFGLLTEHDELLLRILYDDRLVPGMTAAQARPIVANLASELLEETMGGDS